MLFVSVANTPGPTAQGCLEAQSARFKFFPHLSRQLCLRYEKGPITKWVYIKTLRRPKINISDNF